MTEKKKFVGIKIFSALIIITSLMHIRTLFLGKQWYGQLYQFLPEWLLTLRYCFSWFQRLLGLFAAIGLLYRKEICRKIILVISWFTIAMLYWKHPYEAYKNHSIILDQKYGHLFQAMGVEGISFESLTMASLIAQYAFDILFFAPLIYYFTRPAVKEQFC